MGYIWKVTPTVYTEFKRGNKSDSAGLETEIWAPQAPQMDYNRYSGSDCLLGILWFIL